MWTLNYTEYKDAMIKVEELKDLKDRMESNQGFQRFYEADSNEKDN